MSSAPPLLLIRRLAWLASLYIVQGLPFGFQATALPTFLRASGVSLTEIGFLDLLALPWMLKVLWSPLVDRHGGGRWGRRRSWILPLQLLLAVVCGLCAFAPPDRFLALLLGLLFSANLVAATLDIAVDGLAVDVLDTQHLGLGNIAQVVGFKVGMLLGGGLLVWASGFLGWPGLFAGMAFLVLLGLGISILQAPDRGEEARERPQVFRLARDALRAWPILLIVGTYKVGEKMADAMFGAFLVDAGYTPADLGLLLGTYGMVASLLGSVVGGLLASAMPLGRALFLTAALRVVPHALQTWMAFSSETDQLVVIGVACAEAFFGGALTTVMFAFMMAQVDRRIGATHFTLLASVEVLGKAPAAPLAGVLGDTYGYALVFACATALSLLYLVLLPMSRSRVPELSERDSRS